MLAGSGPEPARHPAAARTLYLEANLAVQICLSCEQKDQRYILEIPPSVPPWMYLVTVFMGISVQWLYIFRQLSKSGLISALPL